MTKEELASEMLDKYFFKGLLPIMCVGVGVIAVYEYVTQKDPRKEIIDDLKKNSVPIIQKIPVGSAVNDSSLRNHEILDTVGWYVPAKKLELK